MTMTAAAPFRIRPVICLFGDSITQQGFGVNGQNGWASLLASAYARRADVVNRGFSGYNTVHALELLPRVFGPLESTATPTDTGSNEDGDDDNDDKNSMLFCTVFFGANDAALPGEGQHVPMQQYGDNIGKIVDRIRARCGGGGGGATFPIIFLTPPPVDEKAWAAWREIETSDRENMVAREYGATMKQVAARHDCHAVDTWELLQGDSADRSRFLSDGLHLNESGNQLVYQGLMNLLQTKYPELAPMEDGEGKWGKAGIPLEEKLWQELMVKS
jgi:lysophospholipase L1-like esterase